MSAKQPALYILASAERGTLYTGVTGWLKHRIWEHREGLVEGFSKTHASSTLSGMNCSRISQRQFSVKSK